MKNPRAIAVGARAIGLVAAIVLFIVAAFAEESWQELVGFGLAIVALVLFVDEASGAALRRRVPTGGTVDRRRLMAKSFAYAVATGLFLLGALVSASGALTMFALGFLALAAAVTFDHLADFAVLRAVIEELTDDDAPQAAPAAPAAQTPAPAAPAPAPQAPAAPAATAPATPASDECANCGRKLESHQHFCPACGTARA